MKIMVNGEEKTIEKEGSSITELLGLLDVEMPDMVSVELNGKIVPRDKHGSTAIAQGDRVEFLYFMGGGAFEFSEEQIERYSRHFILEEIGGAGQERLGAASALIIGAGGLGSPSAFYLAAAGVGRIGVVDFDDVELSNLQRQILHGTADVGKPKVESAAEALKNINPHVEVEVHKVWADADNILSLIEPYDLVLDGVDNFGAKFLVNDACVIAGKPFVHAGALRFAGQVFTHVPGSGCLRCIFPTPPPDDAVPTCASAGVLGASVGLMGVLQSIEAVKYFLGLGELLTDRILSFDSLGCRSREMKFGPNPDCPVCGESPQIKAPQAIAAPSCATGVA